MRLSALFLLCFASATAAQSIPIFYLNSTLPSTWRNNDSSAIRTNDGSNIRPILTRGTSLRFVFGFYCNGNCDSYFLSVTIVGGKSPVVVWSANRNRPVKEDASLQLTRDGDLLLRDSDGANVWSTNTSGKSVSGFNMTESGNLVVFNKTRGVVWQSFDYPTDTLLAGQWLREGQMLVSSSSPTSFGSGLYYATLDMVSGLAAFTQVSTGKPEMYYQLAPDEGSSNQTSAVGHCRLLTENESPNSTITGFPSGGGFLVNMGTSQNTSISSIYQSPFDSVIEYVKLGSDGHLSLYKINNLSDSLEILDMVSDEFDICQYPRSCGDYGVCNNNQCSCPVSVNGTHYFKPNKGKEGCSRIKPLSCPLPTNETQIVEVSNIGYFNLIDSDAAVSGIKDIEMCRQACMQNCSCEAVFFKYAGNLSDGYCYMPYDILSFREGQILNNNFTSASYIKVRVPSPGSNTLARILTIIGVCIVAFVVISAIAIIILKRKFRKKAVAILVLPVIAIIRKFRKKTEGEEDEDSDYYVRKVLGMPMRFSYEELRLATKNFSEKLGGGGFGFVYKGVLQDGTVVAVKRLHKMGNALREFLAEVETIGNTHHYNLVRLVGFCVEKSTSLLIYEYMCNGSLDNWIFRRNDRESLDWETRKRVILDIAKGLAYLHEECRKRIIHLDIKPQNVLLDENFSAKISDFGLSTLMGRDESHVLTTLRGTPGYIAPECGRENITIKADIYSFGIVLLEIVSGRRNLDSKRSESSKHLLALLQTKAEEDRLLDIVENLNDLNFEGAQGAEMERMIRIAAWCLQNDPTRRPLMSTIVKVLEGVMDVDKNISFKFAHVTGRISLVRDEIFSAPPQASVLSNPR